MTPETLTPAEVRRQALVAYNAGLCVVPPKEDGTKAPLGEWREYQSQRPSESVLDGWYTHSRTGLGLVCGAISGNLEVLEFDDRAAYEEFRELAEASGLGGLVNRIEAAYCEESPSGGIHWLYRCEKIGGNAKLARRPKLPDEMAHTQDRVKVLIETRGEGGFIITAPSFGDVHPSGQPYRLLQGAFGTIATITPKERAGLFELARTFDQMPKQTVQERPPPRSETSGVRPGDDFNARGEWANILVPHGWRPVFQRGEELYWRRPGKSEGISATTNYQDSGLLYVFSSSTPFETERGYSKFSAYTLLAHGGDHAAAAKALAGMGYGSPGASGTTAGTQTTNGSRPEPDAKATPAKGFILAAEARALLAEAWRFAKGSGVLYVYQGGRYVPALDILQAHLIQRLGDRWVPERAEGIAKWFYSCAPDLWESPPLDRINVQNGLLNRETGELEPHTPDFLCPVQLNVTFDPDADCPAVKSFICDVFPEDTRSLGYEITGMLCTADNTWQVAFLLVGAGSNGKSTFLNLLSTLLGAGNVSNVSLQDLGSNRFATASLYGKLANIFADLSPQRVESASLFKQLVGGDVIPAERKYGQPFSFKPFARLLFSANEIPPSGDATYAYSRRWIVIPFPRQFPVSHGFLDQLTTPEELSGLFNLALGAYTRAKLEGKLSTSESTSAGAETLRDSINPVATFIKECCILGAECRVARPDLYRAYQSWCEANGRRSLSSQKVKQQIQHAYPQVGLRTVHGTEHWHGLGLVADPDQVTF